MTRRGVLMLMLVVISSVCLGQQGETDWRQPVRVLHDMGLKAGDKVADVGCGTGFFTIPLARAVGETGKVFAVDISEKALKSLRARIEKEKVTNVEVTLSEPADAKLPEGEMDAVVLSNVLHHVPEDSRKAFLANVVKSIKPGGVFHLVDWSDTKKRTMAAHDQAIAHDELVKMFEEAGLQLDAEFFYLSYQTYLRFRKEVKK